MIRNLITAKIYHQNSMKLIILPAMKFATEEPRYPHLITTHQEKGIK